MQQVAGYVGCGTVVNVAVARSHEVMHRFSPNLARQQMLIWLRLIVGFRVQVFLFRCGCLRQRQV